MPTCTFCKKKFKEPRGLTIFTFDGKSTHYCSSKCRRNAALGRESRKLNWVRKSPHFSAGKAVSEEN
jgi:large subunit ribosomal protein L24e